MQPAADPLTIMAPLTLLAQTELAACGGTPNELAGVLHNLTTGLSLGQLHQDVIADELVGFVAWIRLSMAQLFLVAHRGVRLFNPADDTPGAPVCLLMEQWIKHRGSGLMLRRARMLGALPGVEVLAGWRGARLRVHRVI